MTDVFYKKNIYMSSRICVFLLDHYCSYLECFRALKRCRHFSILIALTSAADRLNILSISHYLVLFKSFFFLEFGID